jgi:hypothetical protein
MVPCGAENRERGVLVSLTIPRYISRCEGLCEGATSRGTAMMLLLLPRNRFVPVASLSDAVIPLVPQTSHLILSHPIPPSPSPRASYFARRLVSASSSLFLGAEIDRPQLAPLARPNAQAGHERRAGGLQGPPEEVRRDGVRVQRGDEEVDGVEGEREIEDEFAAGDQEEDEDGAARIRPIL